MENQAVMPENTDIERLLVYLPLFDVCGRTFVLNGPDGTPDYAELHVVPANCYEDYLDMFFREISRPCWQTGIQNEEAVTHLVYCDCDIARCQLEDIRRMLSWCRHGDEAIPGFRESLVQDGRLTSILRRLKRLHESRESD